MPRFQEPRVSSTMTVGTLHHVTVNATSPATKTNPPLEEQVRGYHGREDSEL
jgi:hypothetical protein